MAGPAGRQAPWMRHSRVDGQTGGTTDMTNAGTDNERLELADLHQGAGRLQEAEAGYRAVLADDPENADAYNGLGLLAMRIGQHDVAGQLFGMAVELAPGDTVFLCNQGTALYGESRLDEARAVFEQALAHDEHCAKALLNIGIIHKARREYAQSTEVLNRAVVAAPRDPDAFANLAEALLEIGQHDSAENIARAAVNLDNRHVLGLFALASTLVALARPQEALAWAKRLVRYAPGEARFHRLLAECLAHSGGHEQAYREARKAIALAPEDTAGLGLMAEILAGQGEWDQAQDAIERALALKPGDDQLVSIKARVLERSGRKAEAFELVRPLIENNATVAPGTLGAYLTLARRMGEQKQAAEIVDRAMSGRLASRSHYGLYFTAGQLYDDIGDYDRAFDFFRRGNEIKPRTYDRAFAEKQFDAVTTTFTKALFERLSGIGSDSRRPIFIVGMPRSGTSLTEQVIASHPGVTAAGELREIQSIANALPELMDVTTPYPECVPELTRESAAKAAGQYLDFLAELAPDETLRVTDKMPQNFMHLGLIALLFPNARIIHCNRNPLDTCLSCYFQNFAASGLQFAYDQDNLAHYYRLYRRLMAYWREALPLSIHELHYERLVSDPELEIRRMLEFCDLPWDDACLDHTRSGVRTLTASYDQVRQPIYTKSKQRWRHYKKHLKPLINGLGEALAFE